MEEERPKIYSWAIWKKLCVPEHIWEFQFQNEYIEARFHQMYQDFNIGHQIYRDRIELVKPG